MALDDDGDEDVGHFHGDDEDEDESDGLTTEECRITQLLPAPGYHAVFAVDRDGHPPSDDDEETPLVLATRPIHFLAVVNSAFKLYKTEEDLKQDNFIDHDTANTVGAVEIVAGTVRLVSIAKNFAGIMPPGADMSESVGYLRRDYYDRLDQGDSE